MRIGVLPRWQSISAPQSLATIVLDHAREWLRADSNVEVWFAGPKKATQDEWLRWYAPILEETAGRVRFVPCFATVSPRLAGFVSSEETVRFGDQVDVLVSNQPGGTGGLRALTPTPLVQWQMWSSTWRMTKRMPSMFWSEYDMTVEALSAVYADANVWESDAMMVDHFRTLSDVVSDEVVDAVRAKSVVVPNGVKMPPPAVGWGLMWGGNVAMAFKGFPASLEVMKQVEKFTGCDVVVTTPAAQVEGVPERWEVHTHAGRDRFVAAMSDSSVFVCNSTMDTYGVAWLEMLGAGLLGVFEEAWWLEGLLPEWYPLVARDRQEQVEMAVAALMGGKWVGELRRRTVRWVEEVHGLPAVAGKMLNLVKEVAREGAISVEG